ncbi:MAG: hypothetical protein HY547_10200 [Elusimicrobia bacterium]|nr:hypothetical protein [Elusimicrobiota bacterium]
MTARRASIFFFGLFWAVAVSAQNQPDLSRQDQWGEPEKKAFLKFLQSGEQIPALGQVKENSSVSPEGQTHAPSKARYLTLSLAAETLLIKNKTTDQLTDLGASFGPRLLIGGHLFSWMRCYSGIEYHRIEESNIGGSNSYLDHYQVPLGLELALIPLGTPHTRYIILRGGAVAHSFDGIDSKSNFVDPLEGMQFSWMGALGYEGQIPDTKWRLHALVEASKTLDKESPKFYGLGFSLGLVRTF